MVRGVMPIISIGFRFASLPMLQEYQARAAHWQKISGPIVGGGDLLESLVAHPSLATRAAKPQIKPVYQLLTISNQIMLPRQLYLW
jgi:hypothetical protein